MSESFNITFNGTDTMAAAAIDIRKSLEDLVDAPEGFGYKDSEGPSLIVTSVDAEVQINWLLWDVLYAIKNDATVNESDFTSHA